MAIHIHIHSSQTKVRDRKVKDIIKPYVSTILPGGGSKGYYEVLNSKGQTVKTFPYTPAGREEARRFVQSHYNELTKDDSSDVERLKDRVRALERRAQLFNSAGGLPKSHPLKVELSQAREELKKAQTAAKRTTKWI